MHGDFKFLIIIMGEVLFQLERKTGPLSLLSQLKRSHPISHAGVNNIYKF